MPELFIVLLHFRSKVIRDLIFAACLRKVKYNEWHLPESSQQNYLLMAVPKAVYDRRKAEIDELGRREQP